jgi:hypothetical protein
VLTRSSPSLRGGLLVSYTKSLIICSSLVSRLDKLNVGFGNSAAVELLEILECLLVVPSQQRPVTDAKDSPPGST